MPKSTVENDVKICGETLKVRTNDTFSEIDLIPFATRKMRNWFFVDLCSAVQKVLGVQIRTFNLLPSDISNPGHLNLAFFIHDSVMEAEAKNKLVKVRAQTMALDILNPLL